MTNDIYHCNQFYKVKNNKYTINPDKCIYCPFCGKKLEH